MSPARVLAAMHAECDARTIADANLASAEDAVAAARAENVRLGGLLRRPAVWAAHAADPSVVAPECDCAVGSTCQRAGCCYTGEAVPPDVRAALGERTP